MHLNKADIQESETQNVIADPQKEKKINFLKLTIYKDERKELKLIRK